MDLMLQPYTTPFSYFVHYAASKGVPVAPCIGMTGNRDDTSRRS
jgi:hypothetical protein